MRKRYNKVTLENLILFLKILNFSTLHYNVFFRSSFISPFMTKKSNRKKIVLIELKI